MNPLYCLTARRKKLSFWNHRNYHGKQGNQHVELGGEKVCKEHFQEGQDFGKAEKDFN